MATTLNDCVAEFHATNLRTAMEDEAQRLDAIRQREEWVRTRFSKLGLEPVRVSESNVYLEYGGEAIELYVFQWDYETRFRLNLDEKCPHCEAAFYTVQYPLDTYHLGEALTAPTKERHDCPNKPTQPTPPIEQPEPSPREKLMDAIEDYIASRTYNEF